MHPFGITGENYTSHCIFVQFSTFRSTSTSRPAPQCRPGNRAANHTIQPEVVMLAEPVDPPDISMRPHMTPCRYVTFSGAIRRIVDRKSTIHVASTPAAPFGNSRGTASCPSCRVPIIPDLPREWTWPSATSTRHINPAPHPPIPPLRFNPRLPDHYNRPDEQRRRVMPHHSSPRNSGPGPPRIRRLASQPRCCATSSPRYLP
jgi:hypothetical protein